jgi:hypothetical protein
MPVDLEPELTQQSNAQHPEASVIRARSGRYEHAPITE